MDQNSINEILKDISYPGLKDCALVVQEKGDGFLLQIRFIAEDARSGEMTLQYCRKWYISPHSCLNEVVRTAYKAIEAAEEHERNEKFTYRGVAIYNPHYDPRSIAGAKIEENVRLPKHWDVT